MTTAHDIIPALEEANDNAASGTDVDLGRLDITARQLTATSALSTTTGAGLTIASPGGLQVGTVYSVSSTTGPKVTAATAHIGYDAGAGGAVTQLTDATTGVTLSKPTGQITTVALTTAGAAEERFTVTNTLVAATDCIVLCTTYNGAGTPILQAINVAAGAFDILITNVSANALNAVMVINFVLIKGSNTA